MSSLEVLMSAIYDAYNLPVEQLVELYHRLNQAITYPDGMTTSLGIIYWGRDEHLAEIERSIPRLIENGLPRLEDVLKASKTPAALKKLSVQSGILSDILRILKHDIELWLPKPVGLGQLGWFQDNPDCLAAFSGNGLEDQLAVISAGQTPVQRERLASQTNLDRTRVDEIVRLCDFYRTGKTLEHIRSKIYYAMGMDTWEKWAGATSEAIITRFTQYMQENPGLGERLIPWPKEVRNGIEWAKIHLEIFSIQ
jgi:hypothetical protein